MNGKKVVILGNDHTNTIGLLQSLGVQGFYLVAAVWGLKTGLAKASRYCKEVVCGHTEQECVDQLIARKNEFDEAVIIAGCDGAAACLEKNKERLHPAYKFEYTTTDYTIRQLQEKNLQVKLAGECGFNVPKSWQVLKMEDIPKDIVFPCLIKPLVSSEGSKSDLLVCWNQEDLDKNLYLVLSRTPRVLLQQYIQKDFDFIVHGVALSNGDVITQGIIRKDLIFPLNVGLSSFCTLSPLNDEELKQTIKSFINKTGYVGIFSTEFMRSTSDGKLYFCENNFRNDGKIAITYKAGLNIPVIHVCDLLGLPVEVGRIGKEYRAIWEMHHFMSLVHGDISLGTWFKQIKTADIFMVYDKKDKKPVIRQFANILLRRFMRSCYY